MSYGNELKRMGQNHEPFAWVGERVQALGEQGYPLVKAESAGVFPKSLVAYHDAAARMVLEECKQVQRPTELNIVVVPPNGDVGELPVRALGYAASALNLAGYLRNKGIPVEVMRIISPSYISELVNGGKSEQKGGNARQFQKLLVAYRDTYLPELGEVAIEIDTGRELPESSIRVLQGKASALHTQYPWISEELADVSSHYDDDLHEGRNGLEPQHKPLAYLLAHPEAWRYGSSGIIFDAGKRLAINYMPASELRYLQYMCEAGLMENTDHVVTAISANYLLAPYYPLRGLKGAEPTLQDLAGTSVDVLVGRVRLYSGNAEGAQVLQALNQLKSHYQERNRVEKNMPDAHGLVSAFLASVVG